MAKVKFTKQRSNLGHYSNYRSWLESNQYDQLCSYCLTYHEFLDIDHYEPQKMSPKKINHPGNLSLACEGCNGGAGKHDYHPKNKASRRKWPYKSTVINIKKDDYGKHFEIKQNGEIYPRKGKHAKKAHDNILLLKLGRPKLDEKRLEYLELLDSALILESKLTKKHDTNIKTCLTRILGQLNKIELFFHAYNIKLNRTIKRSLKSHKKRAACIK